MLNWNCSFAYAFSFCIISLFSSIHLSFEWKFYPQSLICNSNIFSFMKSSFITLRKLCCSAHCASQRNAIFLVFIFIIYIKSQIRTNRKHRWWGSLKWEHILSKYFSLFNCIYPPLRISACNYVYLFFTDQIMQPPPLMNFSCDSPFLSLWGLWLQICCILLSFLYLHIWFYLFLLYS